MMPIQPRHRRLIFIGLTGAGLAVALALVLIGLRQNVTYFYTPSQVAEKSAALLAGKKSFRLGGMVEKGSVHHAGKDGLDLSFTVTDFNRTLKVRYHGLAPDLFREGQGVVAEGHLQDAGLFEATLLLAKHDEKYMPPEIKKSLGAGGRGIKKNP
ncbi:MAG: cytochrome c maturation protein CcmE [Proteobacteria bacterium]|nr:cytochrome c maturation protein CcmE [Pseudomonadota bacterium]